MSNTVIVVAVPASLNVASLKDLVAMARREPGKLNWVGTTGAVDFFFAGFLKSNGLSMTKVPYRNPVEAVNDLAEGRMHVYMAALAIARPQLQSRQDQAAGGYQYLARPGIPGRAHGQGSRA